MTCECCGLIHGHLYYCELRKTANVSDSPELVGCMAKKFLREETGPQRYGLVLGYGREKYYFERHEVKYISKELLSVIEKWENE